jgi:translation initiation factor 2B subunit (eIF-2B alpha/beta/delta family)
MDLRPDLSARIAAIAANRTAGATELLGLGLEVLSDALAARIPVAPLAQALAGAQPSMASLLTAGHAAVAAEQDPAVFERFRQRLARAPAALVRNGLECLHDGSARPLRIVTISSSASVRMILDALAATRPIHVSCAEGRPALEGRLLAAGLSAAGLQVTLFSDAALGTAVDTADAVLVGADAITSRAFLNKVGTYMLAAIAARHGVPVYVAATRDKFLNDTLAGRLAIRSGDAGEIWDAPPPGVEVRNPYFETVPLELVTSVISDSAVIPGPLVPDACTG